MEDQADQQHPAGDDPEGRALGKVKGEPVEAVARNLPKSETRQVYDKVTKRYWWHAWWWIPHTIIRGGIDKLHSAIEVTAPA